MIEPSQQFGGTTLWLEPGENVTTTREGRIPWDHPKPRVIWGEWVSRDREDPAVTLILRSALCGLHGLEIEPWRLGDYGRQISSRNMKMLVTRNEIAMKFPIGETYASPHDAAK